MQKILVLALMAGSLGACGEPGGKEPGPGLVQNPRDAGAYAAAKPAPPPAAAPAASGQASDAAAVSAPYLLPQWGAAIAAGKRIDDDFGKERNIAALQAYAIVLKYAPAQYFDDFLIRGYFASLLDCEGLTSESKDEFARRDAVERRFNALRAAAAKLPADPVVVTGTIRVGNYDFSSGQFPLGEPSFAEGPLRDYTYPGRLYGIPRRTASAANLTHFLFQNCPVVERRGAFGEPRLFYSFPARMKPHFFSTPTHLQMPEGQARAFREGLSDGALLFEAAIQPSTGGVRPRTTQEEPDFPGGNNKFEGPFIDLHVVDWKIKTADGRTVASMTR